MSTPEATVTLLPGTMINRSNHEDDDCFIVDKPIQASVVGPAKDGGVPIRIPEMEREGILFYHQPEPAEKSA